MLLLCAEKPMAKAKKQAQRARTISITPPADDVALVAIDLKWVIPDGFPITYADQAVVQHFPDEFIVSFFQSSHPVLLTEAEAKALKKVSANCVARFALSPPQMARLTQAMVQNFNKWKEKQSTLLPDNSEGEE